MKKLMIAAAIVCAAAFAQASTVTWGYDGMFNDKDGNMLMMSPEAFDGISYVIYLGADPTALGSATLMADGTVTLDGGAAVAAQGNLDYGVWNGGAALESIVNANGYYQAIAAYKGESMADYYYWQGDAKQLTGVVAGDDTHSLPFSFGSEVQSLSTPGEAVPEPTSGLLLLLGVAGLALKRKNA